MNKKVLVVLLFAAAGFFVYKNMMVKPVPVSTISVPAQNEPVQVEVTNAPAVEPAQESQEPQEAVIPHIKKSQPKPKDLAPEYDAQPQDPILIQ